MKAPLPISILALLLAIVALIVALTSKPTVSEEEISRQVDFALSRKEKAYVQSMAPKMDRIYQEMLGEKYTKPDPAPETFTELFKPAVQLITELNAQ
ncbi:MAG: hypothetical protein JNK37_17695 [Verrucomicrobiales bacterium]|nr:hypothetical protein [Verrucomicrobiales bacterium]